MAELRYPNESRKYREARDALAEGRAGADRQGEGARGEAAQASARRRAEGGLCLSVGQRREGRRAA